MASSTLGIASYFDETVQFYRVFWHGNTGALHFGMGCRAAGTHQQRLLNTNRVLADAIDVLPGERVLLLKPHAVRFRIEVTVDPTFAPSELSPQTESDNRQLGAVVRYVFLPPRKAAQR